MLFGRNKEKPQDNRTPQEIAGQIIDGVQMATESILQRRLAEEQARNKRTDAEILQDRIEMLVTNGLNYRPSPLIDTARRLSLTTDGETDMLTAQVHLVAMDAICMAEKKGSARLHAEFQDLIEGEDVLTIHFEIASSYAQ